MPGHPAPHPHLLREASHCLCRTLTLPGGGDEPLGSPLVCFSTAGLGAGQQQVQRGPVPHTSCCVDGLAASVILGVRVGATLHSSQHKEAMPTDGKACSVWVLM